MDLIGEADGNESTLSVIPAFVLHHQYGTLKNQGCKREVKAALPIIGIALLPIPRESHFLTIQVYIHSVKVPSEDAGAIAIIGKQVDGSGCNVQDTWPYYGFLVHLVLTARLLIE
jgi:hypothetical protein